MIIQKKNAGPGRPSIDLEWPEGEFTAKQVAESLGGSLSRVSVHSKIKKDLNWQPKIKIEEGVKKLLNQIHYWKQAPVWTPKSIKKETKTWFKLLRGK